MKILKKRRFWQKVHVSKSGSGFGVFLDNKLIHTPLKRKFIVPNSLLAVEIAKEWELQESEINIEEMPYTKACNAAIDFVSNKKVAVLNDLVEYGMYDLISYRGDAEWELEKIQKLHWDPLIKWAEDQIGIELKVTNGLMPLEQPLINREILKKNLKKMSFFELTALDQLVRISGSLVISLALVNGKLDQEWAWSCSVLDEEWQEQKWGADLDASDKKAKRKKAFIESFNFFKLLKHKS